MNGWKRCLFLTRICFKSIHQFEALRKGFPLYVVVWLCGYTQFTHKRVEETWHIVRIPVYPKVFKSVVKVPDLCIFKHAALVHKSNAMLELVQFQILTLQHRKTIFIL